MYASGAAPKDLRVRVREAIDSDVPLLAELNRQLIQDERASHPVSQGQLEERLRGWLAAEYRAALFELDGEPVAYALFRPAEGGVHLRQFFVVRSRRRSGLGREAIELFRESFVPAGAALTLDVLVHNTTALAFWRALGFREHALAFRLGP